MFLFKLIVSGNRSLSAARVPNTHTTVSWLFRRFYSSKLTHLDSHGHARMVDVYSKPFTERTAVAEARVALGNEIYQELRGTQGITSKKGDVLATARIAGIMAAKKTPELIPLCHTVPLSSVNIGLVFNDDFYSIDVTAKVSTTLAQTGVEMEALTAASVASLTIYDMCKAMSKSIRIENIRLISKSGGTSGDYSVK